MWLRDQIKIGDVVREVDGRHFGRVVASQALGRYLKVRWEGAGWSSFFDRAEVVLVSRPGTR